MPQIGWLEILAIVIIAILVLGPKEFPIALKKIGSYFGKIKNTLNNFQKEDIKILDNFKNNINIIREKIDNQDINFYIDFIINALFDTNKYFNDQEPWKKKSDILRLNSIVYTTLEIVRKISFMLYPIIPESSLNALKIFSISENDIEFSTIENHIYLKGDKDINKIDILFKKIEKKND